MAELPPELPPPTTPEAAALTRLIGRAAALALIEAYAGTRLYIPRTVNQASPLARTVGLDAARALADRHAMTEIKVPQAKPWRAMVYRTRDRMTLSAIALRLGASHSSVCAWLREAGAAEGAADTAAQLDLFPPG